MKSRKLKSALIGGIPLLILVVGVLAMRLSGPTPQQRGAVLDKQLEVVQRKLAERRRNSPQAAPEHYPDIAIRQAVQEQIAAFLQAIVQRDYERAQNYLTVDSPFRLPSDKLETLLEKQYYLFLHGRLLWCGVVTQRESERGDHGPCICRATLREGNYFGLEYLFEVRYEGDGWKVHAAEQYSRQFLPYQGGIASKAK